MKDLVNKAKQTHKMLIQDIGKIKHYEKEELVLQLQKKLSFLADTGLQLAEIANEINDEEPEFAHMLSIIVRDMFLQVTDAMRSLGKD